MPDSVRLLRTSQNASVKSDNGVNDRTCKADAPTMTTTTTTQNINFAVPIILIFCFKIKSILGKQTKNWKSSSPSASSFRTGFSFWNRLQTYLKKKISPPVLFNRLDKKVDFFQLYNASGFPVFSLSFSLSHTHTLTHTLSLSLPLFLSHTLSLSLS